MNIKTLLTLSLLMASFNAQSAVTACPSGWTKSADGLTCVFEEKKIETSKQSSNNAKPVCISGFSYSSTTAKCEQNTIASQFTANKAYAYMGGLKFGSDPQEEDKCLNFTGTQTVQPANSYQSGGGNCACNSGFQYNVLSGDSASCNYFPQEVVINVNGNTQVVCPPGKKIISHSLQCFEGGCSVMFNNGTNTSLSYSFNNNSYAYGISDCIISPYVTIYGNITCK
jgi:hypothetical protein